MMDSLDVAQKVSGTESRRRRRASFGLVALAVVGLGLAGFVAWGVTTSRPAPIALLPVPEAQWKAITKGDLVEQTVVSGTVSRGEVFSISVPQAPIIVASTTTTVTTAVSTTVPADSLLAAASDASSVAAAGQSTVGVDATANATSTTQATSAGTATVPVTVPAAGGAVGGGSRSSTRIVTGLASVGAVLHSGDVVFSVDGRPTVMMNGAVPAWRAINAETTPGEDVLQLETSLAAAGFDSGGWMEVDDTVDDATVEAIQDWQRSLDVEPTGEVPLGEVVFEPADVTVVALNSTIGSVVSPGSALVDLRRGQPYVDVSTDASWVKVDQKVQVSVDQTRLNATVVSLESGIARVQLDGANLRDGSTARVTLTKEKVTAKLLVPASAILVSDVDGPQLRVRSGGSVRIVNVKVLASANSTAAIEAAVAADAQLLAEGMEVQMY